MVWVYTGIVSLVVAILSFVLQTVIKENRELKKKQETQNETEQNALKEGLKCLLRDHLIGRHSEFVKQGHISTHGLQNWLAMHAAYKALGGNGLIDHMKEEIEALPIR